MVCVFFVSPNPGNNRQPIALPDGRTVYIRAAQYEGDLEDALDYADMCHDEDLMNSHEL